MYVETSTRVEYWGGPAGQLGWDGEEEGGRARVGRGMGGSLDVRLLGLCWVGLGCVTPCHTNVVQKRVTA